MFSVTKISQAALAAHRYYEGSTPVLVVSDPDAVQDVLVKQFHNFCGRKDFPLLPDQDTFEDCNMFLARGNRWKRLRTICNPNFSTAKMKEIKPLMDKCLLTTLNLLEERSKEGKPFDVYKYVQGLTLDIIAETAFGIETSVQTDPNDDFLRRCRRFFAGINLVEGPALLIAALILPELRPLFININFGLDAVRERPENCIKPVAVKVIERRKATQEVRADILQLMIESLSDKKLSREELLSAELKQLTADLEFQPDSYFFVYHEQRQVILMGLDYGSRFTPLTEVVSNSILLLVAGYETTSTTMGYLMYLLAIYPDVQTKLIHEIDEFVQTADIPPSYDVLKDMIYLDQVVNETLRLFPVASLAVSRRCMQNCTIGSNIFVPKGTYVHIDVWTMHYDPDHWGPVDPELFYPERFESDTHKQRHPMAYIPFGGGPKNCLGMRFALLEIKLALVMLLKRFIIRRCAETEHPIQVKEGITITPKNGVTVILESRA